MACVSDFVHRQLIASGDLRVLYDIRQPKLLELGGIEIESPMRRDNTHPARNRKHKSGLLLPERSQAESDHGIGSLEYHEGGPVALEEHGQMVAIEYPMINRWPYLVEEPGERR